MLSRVVRPGSSSKVELLEFASVGIDPASAYSRPESFSEDTGLLRERLNRAEAGLAEATRQAFEEGRRKGEQQARAELDPVLGKLSTALGEIAELRPNLRHRAERDVVSLAILIARRVLHREINVDHEALTAIARVAFDRLARAESYRVRVHPRFAEAVRAALPATAAGHVEIHADAGCAPGSLIIQTPEGSIDASIDTQLDEIDRGLTDRLGLTKK